MAHKIISYFTIKDLVFQVAYDDNGIKKTQDCIDEFRDKVEEADLITQSGTVLGVNIGGYDFNNTSMKEENELPVDFKVNKNKITSEEMEFIFNIIKKRVCQDGYYLKHGTTAHEDIRMMMNVISKLIGN